MTTLMYQVDAFTNRPFKGNPAGVCLLEGAADDQWMQQVASEMNLSETAFVQPKGSKFQLRWFTPTVEVDLCGHATLAAAHILWETGVLEKDQPAYFDTRSGVLSARWSKGWIDMDFPAEPATAVDPPAELLEAISDNPLFVGQSRFDYLVELPSEEDVRSLAVEYDLLKNVATRGIIVTSRSENIAYDFVSRFFAPAVGVNEDPVTGSAHCTLGPYWGKILGKSELTAYQASARGGIVKLRCDRQRVVLRGQAVTVMRIELMV